MSLAVQDELRSRLERHMSLHGLTLEQVLGQIDDVFGDPLLVVASGSVIAGYGNERSDLDLFVVVPDEVASSLPLMSYPRGARVEVLLYGAGTLAERHRQLAGGWPPPDPDPQLAARHRRSANSVSGFGLGLPLVTDGGPWQAWQRQVDADIAGWLSSWYAVEAVRKRVAARQLLPAKPRLAAMKAGEAMIAALERRAVLAGERYFKWKWLGEKFRRLGDEQGHAWFREAICPPLAVADSADYVRHADEVVAGVLADLDTSRWRLRLVPAPGTARHQFGGECLVSRWALRTVAVDERSPAAVEQAWDYGLDEPWHPDVAGVFAEDMLWLGVADGDGASTVRASAGGRSDG